MSSVKSESQSATALPDKLLTQLATAGWMQRREKEKKDAESLASIAQAVSLIAVITLLDAAFRFV